MITRKQNQLNHFWYHCCAAVCSCCVAAVFPPQSQSDLPESTLPA
nr:hypothetical protein Itr_chr15CG00450 [Ipomoea trifida]GLL48537.1 hypothetical protein Itr_chr15CG00460 [Ipomoea trifida]